MSVARIVINDIARIMILKKECIFYLYVSYIFYVCLETTLTAVRPLRRGLHAQYMITNMTTITMIMMSMIINT